MRPVCLLVALALGGCSIFHDPYPDRVCQSDPDCWAGQKEYCNRETGLCEPKPDAAPRFDAAPHYDSPPQPDASDCDAAIDAEPADAGPDAEVADAPIDAIE